MRENLQNFFHSKCYNVGITLIILLNCIVLGLDTSDGVRSACGAWLSAVDSACLAVFVVELLLKIYAFKLAFFTGKDRGWNAFDFIIVAISLLGNTTLSVLRALRVFRALRLLSALPQKLFGTLSQSFLTLFQLMIMDDFGNLVRPIVKRFAWAWVVFVSFVLIVGFVVLNLVVGIIVESINEIKERRNE